MSVGTSGDVGAADPLSNKKASPEPLWRPDAYEPQLSLACYGSNAAPHGQLIADRGWNLSRPNQFDKRDVIEGDCPMNNMVCTRVGSAAAWPAQVAARETSSDEMLIRRIAGGDQLAMRTLFCNHRVALYPCLLRLVPDATSALYLLSDVFLDVWRQAASFERGS